MVERPHGDPTRHCNQSAAEAYRSGFLQGIGAVAKFGSQAAATKAFPKFSHTVGYYIASITDFYVTHPEASAASIGDVMSCLADNAMFSCSFVAKHSHPQRFR